MHGAVKFIGALIVIIISIVSILFYQFENTIWTSQIVNNFFKISGIFRNVILLDFKITKQKKSGELRLCWEEAFAHTPRAYWPLCTCSLHLHVGHQRLIVHFPKNDTNFSSVYIICVVHCTYTV